MLSLVGLTVLSTYTKVRSGSIMVSSSAKSGFNLLALWLVIEKLPSYFSCHHRIFYMEFENNDKHFGANVHFSYNKSLKDGVQSFPIFFFTTSQRAWCNWRMVVRSWTLNMMALGFLLLLFLYQCTLSQGSFKTLLFVTRSRIRR
jgi:hypothetical protein